MRYEPATMSGVSPSVVPLISSNSLLVTEVKSLLWSSATRSRGSAMPHRTVNSPCAQTGRDSILTSIRERGSRVGMGAGMQQNARTRTDVRKRLFEVSARSEIGR